MTTLMQPPIALYSGPLTIDASMGGAGTSLDPQKMQNPARAAMWIDEVRFTLLGAQAEDATLNAYGGTLGVRLRVNRQNVTAGFVPLWSLSKSVNNGLATGLSDIQTTTLNTYIYKPPVPIYVPNYSNLLCDLAIDPVAERQAEQQLGNIKIGVVYAGREVNGRVPLEIPTPFAAMFNTTPFVEGVNNRAQRSTQNDLVSPFAEPLHVKSIIGRCLIRGADAQCGGAGTGGTPPLYPLTTIRIMNSNGAIVARDYIPSLFLFDGINREWTMDTILAQKQALIASVQADLTDYVANGGAPIFQYAMHGFRNVPVSHY